LFDGPTFSRPWICTGRTIRRDANEVRPGRADLRKTLCTVASENDRTTCARQ
jgi:hypothetical protein